MNNFAKIFFGGLIFIFSFSSAKPQDYTPAATIQDQEVKLRELYKLFNETYKDSVNIGFKYAQEALTLSRKAKNTYYEVEALNYLGRRESILFKYESAKTILNKAYKLSLTTGNDYLIARSCLRSGWNYLEIGMADSAIFYCRKGYELAVRINHQELLEYLSTNLACSYNLKGEKSKALEYCRKSLEINKNNKKLIANNLSLLSQIYNDIGRLEEATKYALQAIEIFKELKYFDKIGYPYLNLSQLYEGLNDKKKSQEYLKLAVEIFEKTNNLRGLSYVYNYIGGRLLRDNPSEALQYYYKSLKYRTLINEKQGISFTEGNIANVFSILGKPDSILFHLNKSFKAANEIQDPLALSQVYLGFASYNSRFISNKTAIEYALRALVLLKQIKYLESEENTYEMLSNCYNEMGDSRNSLYYLKLKNEVHDTLYTQEMRKSVANLRMKYDVEEKEKELAAFAANKTDLESRVEFQRLLTWITILGSSLVIGLVLFYYRKKVVAVMRFFKTIPQRSAEDKRRMKSVMKSIENQTEILTTKHIDTEIAENILSKLAELMINEKVFLNPQISQQEIAKRLNTNTAYLSRIINDKLSSNFSNYVNHFRIEEAKLLILSNKENNLSFEGIGQVVGFNSKSAFNYAFKKATGKTPTIFASENSKTLTNQNT